MRSLSRFTALIPRSTSLSIAPTLSVSPRRFFTPATASSHQLSCGCPLCASRLSAPHSLGNGTLIRLFASSGKRGPPEAQKKGGDAEVQARENAAHLKASGVQSQNLYEDQEEVGRTEDDPNIVMDHVQMARRVAKQPREQHLKAEKAGGDDIVDKPAPGTTAPSGVSYS